jgi:hypothetical protein
LLCSDYVALGGERRGIQGVPFRLLLYGMGHFAGPDPADTRTLHFSVGILFDYARNPVLGCLRDSRKVFVVLFRRRIENTVHVSMQPETLVQWYVNDFPTENNRASHPDGLHVV